MKAPDLKRFPAVVLFDYDGVLVSSESIHAYSWKQLLKELHLPLDLDWLQESVGKTSPQILTELLNHHRPGLVVHSELIEEWVQKKNQYYSEYSEGKLALYPGVAEGMDWLKSQGICIGVVSNSRKKELQRALKALKIAEHLSTIVSRDDVVAPKPASDPYRFALEQLHFSPEQGMAVEDSPIGLQAALLAGLTAAAVTTNFPQERLQQPILDQPQLKPIWIGSGVAEYINWLKVQKTQTSSHP